jgi:uncharacterized membrane protein
VLAGEKRRRNIMIWLILGVVLWSLVHFIPSIGIKYKERIIARFGENPYKIMFSLIVLGSIALMVLGWRSTDPEFLYQLPDWSRMVTVILMLVAFVLMVAARRKSIIKQFIRHPQLTGVAVWSIAHLISNGDTRSLVLFGGMGLWALIEIRVINARDGVWKKPERPALSAEFIGLAISFVVFAVFVFLHPYFTGFPVVAH